MIKCIFCLFVFYCYLYADIAIMRGYNILQYISFFSGLLHGVIKVSFRNAAWAKLDEAAYCCHVCLLNYKEKCSTSHL